jgi:hypothetical protein
MDSGRTESRIKPVSTTRWLASKRAHRRIHPVLQYRADPSRIAVSDTNRPVLEGPDIICLSLANQAATIHNGGGLLLCQRTGQMPTWPKIFLTGCSSGEPDSASFRHRKCITLLTIISTLNPLKCSVGI